VKTIGQYLVDEGVLTPAQVDAALERQRAMASRGEQRRFGEVLLEMRLATAAQVQAAIDRQQRERT
jgi:hypothetical protein